ncbi:YceK/YidQ family lipoprotein [Geotalea toluenoxydans]|uniref:YceK/YidQ family lipoprotein n=1 Tax=Geotalea toluenoxydans TaxID=421624 RepID=UPI0006CFB6C0|nr:YceK/YidQ family lipoprotein [Geotalea toluenoxydans]
MKFVLQLINLMLITGCAAIASRTCTEPIKCIYPASSLDAAVIHGAISPKEEGSLPVAIIFGVGAAMDFPLSVVLDTLLLPADGINSRNFETCYGKYSRRYVQQASQRQKENPEEGRGGSPERVKDTESEVPRRE